MAEDSRVATSVLVLVLVLASQSGARLQASRAPEKDTWLTLQNPATPRVWARVSKRGPD